LTQAAPKEDTMTAWPTMAKTGLALLLSASLAGCGGGGGGDPPAEPGPPPPGGGTTLTITGVAATGAPLANQPVAARCAAGSGSATTDAVGAFSLSVSSGSLPCALKVATASGDLFSLAPAAGSATATANLTPLTQLLVAQLARQEPSAYYDAFSAAAASALTAAAIQGAQDGVKNMLATGDVDVSAAGHWLNAPLVPRGSGAPGNAYAQALDALAQSLTSAGTTLAAFTSTVAAQSATVVAPSSVASLPAALLLRQAAPTCAALRSGRYRFITPTPNAALASQLEAVTFDATTMTLTRADGGTSVWAANGNCRFTDSGAGWTADIAVYASGVWAGRYSRDGGASYRPLVALPQQTHAVADLRGNWQQMGMTQGAAGFAPFTGSTTFDAAGVVTAGTECRNDTTWSIDSCNTLGAPALALFAPLRSNSDGGFDMVAAGAQQAVARLLAYRAGGGYLMLVSVSGSGFSIWTPLQPVTMPDVGTVAYNANYNITGSLAAGSAEFTTNTVLAQDTAAGSWTRAQQFVVGGVPMNFVVTLLANRPREGLFRRPASTVPSTDGLSTLRLSEFTAMRVWGMGFSPSTFPSTRLFQLSGGVPAP
jgi:hypothetical protein